MTTTQPPLKPGQHVLVEFEVGKAASGVLWPISADGAVMNSPVYLRPDYRWRPMPAADSPDAAHVARLEAELASAKAAYEGEAKAYLFMEQVTIRLGAEIERLLAERDALRKVYDAAEAIRDADSAGMESALAALDAAVDAFRAGQKAPADAPGATLADEKAKDAPSDETTVPEAQGGAEAVGWSWRLESDVTPVGGLKRYWAVCGTCGVLTPISGDPNEVGRWVTEHAVDEHGWPKPAAQPQPTDAPGRRDWAGKIAEILDAALFDTKASKALAEHIVAALRLDELGEERDDLREALGEEKETVAWLDERRKRARRKLRRARKALKETTASLMRLAENHGTEGAPHEVVDVAIRAHNEARAQAKAFAVNSETNVAHALGYDTEERYPGWRDLLTQVASEHRELLDLRQRDEAAGKYDALRAGLAQAIKAWDAEAERLLTARDVTDDRNRRARFEHVASAWRGAASEAQRLLDAPPTTTTDGTGTADLLPGCPVEVWDGPYQYRCAMGGTGNVCAQHGPFTPALRCAVTPGCRRPERHGGRCNPLTDGTGTATDGSEGGGK